MHIQETFQTDANLETTMDWDSGSEGVVATTITDNTGLVLAMSYIPVDKLADFIKAICYQKTVS